jgi:deoxyribodipyrimidine photo-lyase
LNFYTTYKQILDRIDAIDPVSYGGNRNFCDGSVTYLSPYISRGIISTKFVLHKLFEKGYVFKDIEKFIQELAWRDYWQQVWISKADDINKDLKSIQSGTEHQEIPSSLINGKTGIKVVDRGISELKETGYMHNHMRMYVASIACNIGRSHWKTPARWMYYELLDGDWASNALSWQWVAGTNANKKYYANQENINKYFYSDQKDTFLDKSYEELIGMDCPEVLRDTVKPQLKIDLPKPGLIQIQPELPTLIYNYYNLDPLWRNTEEANRILLLEPSVFEQYPVSPKCLKFALDLGKNISDLQVFTGEFDDLIREHSISKPVFKEHPLNKNYKGQQDDRDWMFEVKGYFPSFFGFWKKCKKEFK